MSNGIISVLKTFKRKVTYHARSEQNVQKLHKVEIRGHHLTDQPDTHCDHLTGILK